MLPTIEKLGYEKRESKQIYALGFARRMVSCVEVIQESTPENGWMLNQTLVC